MNKNNLLVALFLVTLSSVMTAQSMPVYFGTYGKGIYLSELNMDSGHLSEPVLVAETPNPSFIEVHPSGKYIYAVSEYEGSGGVSAFAIVEGTQTLKFLNKQSSGGDGTSHITVDHAGKNVLTANYSSGNAAVIPILPDGSLGKPTGQIKHEGSSVNKDRQDAPHPHSINVSPDDRFVFVADLGNDKVMIHQLDNSKGTITANNPPFAQMKPGAGPRHFTFHPSGKFAYVINELNGAVTAFSCDSASGALTEIQTITTLPEGFKGVNTSAEIRAHPNGKFLYGSNRGDFNSIVVYRIDPDKGTLTFVEHETAGINIPRNFNIDPTGAYCVVGNQGNNTVVVFRIDPATGKLEPTGQKLNLESPVCVRFLNK